MIPAHLKRWFAPTLALLALFAGPPAPATAAAGPAELEVVEGVAHYNHLGMARVAGMIVNRGTQPVCAPQVQVQWLDASGRTLAVNSVVTLAQSELGREAADGVMAQRRYLPAGEAAVFTYRRDLRKIAGVPAGHRIRATARACAGPQASLVMSQLTHAVNRTGFMRVEGMLSNPSSRACAKPLVVIGMFDAKGSLLESDVIRLPAPHEDLLAGGASTPFSRKSLPRPMDQDVARVRAWPDCADAP